MRKVGMWSIVGVALITSGCAGWGEYQELEAKHGHLLEVKEQWEGEKSELSASVEEARRSFQHIAMEQAALKTQVETTLQTLRAAKAELQGINTKVEGQGTQMRDQQRQIGSLTEQFSQVISQVATLAETNQALANRVEQLTKVARQTAAMKVADANKKLNKASVKEEAPKPEKLDEEAAPKEKGTEVSRAEPSKGVAVSAAPVSTLPNGENPPQPSVASSSGSLPGGAGPVSPPAASSTAVSKAVPPAVAPAPLPTAMAKTPETPSSSTDRWDQLKDLFGKLRPAGTKSAPTPTALSTPPVSAPTPGTSGEAIAAPLPTGRRFSTISTTEGTAAPGAVVPSPTIPPVTKP